MQTAAENKRIRVLFVCVHNKCRSQMAEALARRFYGDYFAPQSAGTEIADHIDAGARDYLWKTYGIDMEKTQHPKTFAEIDATDVLVTMGCDVICPSFPSRYREDWGLDDPSGKPEAAYKAVADSILEKLQILKERTESSFHAKKG